MAQFRTLSKTDFPFALYTETKETCCHVQWAQTETENEKRFLQQITYWHAFDGREEGENKGA